MALAAWYFGADPRALLKFFNKPAGPDAKQVAPANPGPDEVAGGAPGGGAGGEGGAGG